MDAPKISILVLQLLFTSSLIQATPTDAKIFREYIGAEGKNVTFSEVPINPDVDFHFLLSFAIDYTNSKSPIPTNGDFRVFWDSVNLSPCAVKSIKAHHPNVKVIMSLAGDTVNGKYVNFSVITIHSWVSNAIQSITRLAAEYSLDGIDVDYEHFNDIDPDIFAECIGKLFFYLKQNNIVSFTSIAPYDDESVQPYYLALWKKYGHLIDMVDFQFYAYEKGTTISQFLEYFRIQSSNYEGSKLLVSFGTDRSGGLKPENGFFEACDTLKKQGKLHGIFIWSADDSKEAQLSIREAITSLLGNLMSMFRCCSH